MKPFSPETSSRLTFQTGVRQTLLDITEPVADKIRRRGFQQGVVHLFVKHTTCVLTIIENADPDVVQDLLRRLETLVPRHDHEDRHQEGNSSAHLKSSLLGSSLLVPVQNGKLVLGTWQGLFLAEFDGPRTRTIELTFLPCS